MLFKCTKCLSFLEADKFSKCSSNRDGLQNKCKACVKSWYTKRNAQPGFISWLSMKQRVSAKSDKAQYYYDRGITMDVRWSNYEVFIRDVGIPPTPKHTLERIDLDGNYERGNVVWVDRKEQANNRSSNFRITHDGETLTVREWSLRLGGNPGLVSGRIARGWSEKLAVSTKIDGSKTYKGSPKDITFNGETLSRFEWDRRIGACRGTVTKRLSNGWTVERAVTEVVDLDRAMTGS